MRQFRTLLVAALLGLGMGCKQAPDAETYMDFLYQYMPQPDQTDYPRHFFQHNVELALQAREEMPWGAAVPEREFRHFVLPVRVNNEHLDNAREVFYAELKPRVQHLDMQQAILEVNHWCHEKVTYRPSDARTSSPLATVRTAYGRCGEESTFLVAALRAVGIPARQVYTPRWAHTDDNHAWVEAWADGRWWFLGACEPEPVLNLGWFNESASRGMLMHTRVFGEYDGPEEVMSRSHYFTEINVTDTYAPTTRIDIEVVDGHDKPVADALVEFKLYNYAEFYTVAQKPTDARGRTFLTAGRGDMLVWVSKDGKFAFQKVTFDKPKTVTVKITDELPAGQGKAATGSNTRPDSLLATLSTLLSPLDLTPPKANASLPPVTPEQRAENERRKAREDSIRAAYEATMPVEAWRGNHEVLSQFLDEQRHSPLATKLLEVVSAKDLRDIGPDVLRDNMATATTSHPAIPDDIYHRYVLSPRVENEHLVPYKQFFRKELQRFVGQPANAFVSWALQYVSIDDSQNPQRLRMSPLSTYRERQTDRLSRDIFFVSAARSIGIPARINEINGKLQYWDGEWKDAPEMEEGKSKTEDGATVAAGSQAVTQADTVAQSSPVHLPASISLSFSPTRFNDNPKYYTHFTLSRIEEGRLHLLEYPEEATWKDTFADGEPLDPGQYLLVTGTRLANGGVLARATFFSIEPGQQATIPLILRESREDVQVIGSLNAEDIYQQMEEGRWKREDGAANATGNAQEMEEGRRKREDGATDAAHDEQRGKHRKSPDSQSSTPDPLSSTSLLATAGRGYYVLGIIAPGQEPTNHALRDIAACKDELEQWGRKIILLFESEDDARRFNFSEHKSLPNTVCWGIDKDGAILNELQPLLEITDNSIKMKDEATNESSPISHRSTLPVFVIADSFNRVVFIQQGYTIGLGEQLIQVKRKL